MAELLEKRNTDFYYLTPLCVCGKKRLYIWRYRIVTLQSHPSAKMLDHPNGVTLLNTTPAKHRYIHRKKANTSAQMSCKILLRCESSCKILAGFLLCCKNLARFKFSCKTLFHRLPLLKIFWQLKQSFPLWNVEVKPFHID